MVKFERVNQHNNPVIGMNISRLRRNHKMKNAELVAKLQLQGVCISSSTLSKIERGRSNPSVDMLVGITKVFKCDFNELFKC